MVKGKEARGRQGLEVQRRKGTHPRSVGGKLRTQTPGCQHFLAHTLTRTIPMEYPMALTFEGDTPPPRTRDKG